MERRWHGTDVASQDIYDLESLWANSTSSKKSELTRRQDGPSWWSHSCYSSKLWHEMHDSIYNRQRTVPKKNNFLAEPSTSGSVPGIPSEMVSFSGMWFFWDIQTDSKRLFYWCVLNSTWVMFEVDLVQAEWQRQMSCACFRKQNGTMMRRSEKVFGNNLIWL